MSNLRKHAEYELSLLDWTDDKEVYNGLLSKSVLELIDLFSKQGHSGASAYIVREVFYKLSKFEALTELTTNPDEWLEYVEGEFQSKRNPSCFSRDLKYYYNLDGEKVKLDEIDSIPHIKGYKLIKLREYIKNDD
jgi:hypothetical protein